MKLLTYILFILMTISCSGSSNSSSHNLTWYKNATITQISEDPENPEKMLRISIGISPQIFYLSKKASDYPALLEKLEQSNKKGKIFNIGIENNTNLIKEVEDTH